jgi:hypothetical protein
MSSISEQFGVLRELSPINSSSSIVAIGTNVISPATKWFTRIYSIKKGVDEF